MRGTQSIEHEEHAHPISLTHTGQNATAHQAMSELMSVFQVYVREIE